MTRIPLMVLIELTVAFVLLAPFLITGEMKAQAQIITVPMPENNTKLILNMKDHTQTLVNATTNERISVEKFIIQNGNETTNETLPGSSGNITSNETLPGSSGNITSNDSLTDKFRELGK